MRELTESCPRRWGERLRLLPPIHALWYALRWVGIRDRLRCPDCKAVGTWKPHGTRSARRNGDRPARRWLCKYCGHYEGPEGVLRCWPDPKLKVWVLPTADVEPLPTPRDLLREHGNLWPWKG